MRSDTHRPGSATRFPSARHYYLPKEASSSWSFPFGRADALQGDLSKSTLTGPLWNNHTIGQFLTNALQNVTESNADDPNTKRKPRTSGITVCPERERCDSTYKGGGTVGKVDRTCWNG